MDGSLSLFTSDKFNVIDKKDTNSILLTFFTIKKWSTKSTLFIHMKFNTLLLIQIFSLFRFEKWILTSTYDFKVSTEKLSGKKKKKSCKT